MSLLNIPQSLRLAQTPIEDVSVTPPVITVPGLKLGQAANLLLGFKPGWVATDASTSPFFSPNSEPLPTSDTTISLAGVASWGFPRITLHDNRNSMLSAVFPYDVQSLTGATRTIPRCARSRCSTVGAGGAAPCAGRFRKCWAVTA